MSLLRKETKEESLELQKGKKNVCGGNTYDNYIETMERLWDLNESKVSTLHVKWQNVDTQQAVLVKYMYCNTKTAKKIIQSEILENTVNKSGGS